MNLQYHHAILFIAREFDELNNEDAMLPLDQRGETMAVFAMRSWQYGLFERLRK